MIKQRETRIQEYLQYLDDEYSIKPRKWWQTDPPRYIKARNFAHPLIDLQDVPEITIIKFDLKRALQHGALFLCTTFLLHVCMLSKYDEINMQFTLFLILVGIFVLHEPLREIKRKPKLMLTAAGIWFHTIEEMIPWNDIVAVYIKEEESGENSKTHHLNIHYYSEKYDIFYLAEIKLTGLDVSMKALAAEIEYRRLLTEV